MQGKITIKNPENKTGKIQSRLLSNDNSFEKGSFIIFILSVIAGVLNYGFQILSGRALSVQDFGELTAMISIYSIYTVFGKALMTSVAVNTTNITNFSFKPLFLNVFKKMFPFICVSFPISILVAVFMDSSPLNAFLITLSAFVLLFRDFLYGILQRFEKLKEIGLLELIVPLYKIIICIPLFFVGFGTTAFFVSIILANITSIIITLLTVQKSGLNNAEKNFEEKQLKDFSSRILNHYFFSLIINFSLIVFNNLDILLVKHYFDADTAGQYSAAALFGKMILYISSALVMALIPAVAGKPKSIKTLNKSLIYSAGLTLIASAGLFIIKKPLVVLLMGDKFLNSINFFVPCCVTMGLLALVTIASNYLLAINDKVFVSVSGILSILLILILVTFINSSVAQLLYAISVVYGILLIVLYTRSLFFSFKTRRSSNVENA